MIQHLIYVFAKKITVHIVKMPPPKSNAWKYFKCLADDKTIKCTLCSCVLTYTALFIHDNARNMKCW